MAIVNFNVLYELNWTRSVDKVLKHFEEKVASTAASDGYLTYDETEAKKKWSFSGKFSSHFATQKFKNFFRLFPRTFPLVFLLPRLLLLQFPKLARFTLTHTHFLVSFFRPLSLSLAKIPNYFLTHIHLLPHAQTRIHRQTHKHIQHFFHGTTTVVQRSVKKMMMRTSFIRITSRFEYMTLMH